MRHAGTKQLIARCGRQSIGNTWSLLSVREPSTRRGRESDAERIQEMRSRGDAGRAERESERSYQMLLDLAADSVGRCRTARRPASERESRPSGRDRLSRTLRRSTRAGMVDISAAPTCAPPKRCCCPGDGGACELNSARRGVLSRVMVVRARHRPAAGRERRRGRQPHDKEQTERANRELINSVRYITIALDGSGAVVMVEQGGCYGT